MMCATCGCEGAVHGEHEQVRENEHGHGHVRERGHGHVRDYDHVHVHEHGDGHGHAHAHAHAGRRTISVELDVLAKNDELAAQNRARFAERGIAVFNFTSAPGAGKTSLLEAVIRRLRAHVNLAVVEGDQETERDAERIRGAGAAAVQINTRTGCHLDAEMVKRAAAELDPPPGSLLLIENVGNLVCPALFDLGERAKVVVMSVTEGEDKPLKYPHMFRAAEVLVLTKTDLLPHLDFDLAQGLANARRVNPALRLFQLSVKDGSGVAAFCDWMASQVVVRP
jgi:hydrogenase nickel incorporation protein HypB